MGVRRGGFGMNRFSSVGDSSIKMVFASFLKKEGICCHWEQTDSFLE